MAPSSAEFAFRPVASGTGKEIRLAMQSLFLAGRILPVGARLTVRHVFECQEDKPLEVIYAFALPRDAALRRFQVTGANFSVRSELKPVAEAQRAYEAGLEKGHLATLARQYRDGIMNLTLGNLRPGETVTVTLQILAGVEMRDDGLRFRFPFTLAPSYHPGAKTVLMPDGMGEMELPEDEFGDVILPNFARSAAGLHHTGFDLSVWMPGPIEELGSPSHPVRVRRQDAHHSRVCLAASHDIPDRDLVLDVRATAGSGGILAGLDSEGKGSFAAVIPSTAFGDRAALPHRIVMVLDRSGSMGGLPLDQARKAMEACLTALSESDSFGLIVFDNHVESLHPALTDATQSERDAAREFLRGIHARGGTELASAVLTAAQMLGRDGGDILVVTDGQVFGTEKILSQVRSAAVRIHCLGIGSASQDRFLASLARDTGGISRFVTPRERVDIPAVDLFAAIGRPVASGVTAKVDGFAIAAFAPDPPATVFAGSPWVLYGETGSAGDGSLRLNWNSDGVARETTIPLHVAKSSLGETLRLIRGARLLTDLENSDDTGERLEEISRSFGLTSRRMALVAVVERAGDEPREIPTTRIVPVGMPQDLDIAAYIAQGALRVRVGAKKMASRSAMPLEEASRAGSSAMFSLARRSIMATAPPPSGPEDLLLDLAAHIQADGGMPGENDEQRALSTLLALLCFAAEGHTEIRGTFRTHVQRLIAFLEKHATEALVRDTLARVRTSGPPPGNWVRFADPLRQGQPPDADRFRRALLACAGAA